MSNMTATEKRLTAIVERIFARLGRRAGYHALGLSAGYIHNDVCVELCPSAGGGASYHAVAADNYGYNLGCTGREAEAALRQILIDE